MSDSSRGKGNPINIDRQNCGQNASSEAGSAKSLRIVKDHAECVATTGMQPADAMAHGHTIDTARAAYRPMMYRKNDDITLSQVDDLGSRLHARPLLGQDELAAREIG